MKTEAIINRLKKQNVLSQGLFDELYNAWHLDTSDAYDSGFEDGYSCGFEVGEEEGHYAAQESLDYLYP